MIAQERHPLAPWQLNKTKTKKIKNKKTQEGHLLAPRDGFEGLKLELVTVVSQRRTRTHIARAIGINNGAPTAAVIEDKAIECRSRI